MKNGFLYLVACTVLTAIPLCSLCALSYTESSNGLIPPSFDGGRSEIEMADIDQNGNIDLISIGDHGSPYLNTDQHGIMVWFGDGTGSWSVYMNGNFGYGGIAIGDVNNDKDLDAGYAMHHNYSSNDFGDQLIEVALGDGTGQNWQPWDDSLAMEGQDWGMFGTDFADFNNDGLLDICSNAFGYDDGVHAYTNNGNGTWHYTYGFIGGNSTMDIVCGDVNNDGNADFAVSHQGGTVYIGDGIGNFTIGDGNLPSGGNMGLYGVTLRDVDDDGDDDIAFCNSDGGVEVWRWISSNTWQDISGTLPSSGSYESSQLFDMNVDGICDIAAFGSSTVTVWIGDSAGNWTQEVNFNTPSPGYCEAFRVGGDADHNGFPDIVLLSDEGSWPSYQNHLHFYKESSTPENLAIRPIEPHGYEKCFAGSVHFIDWISSVPDSSSTVKLDLSISGSTGPWHLITASVPDNGRYQWLIPDTLSSSDCFIMYTIVSGSDTAKTITPSAFEILGSSHYSEAPMRKQTLKAHISIVPTIASKTATCQFHIGEPGPLEIAVYDISGRMVRKLIDIAHAPANGTLLWDCTGDNGESVQSGTYFIQLRIPGKTLSGKVIVVR
jgi:hypothetical protein